MQSTSRWAPNLLQSTPAHSLHNKGFSKTIAAKKIPEAKNRSKSINVNKKLFRLAHFIFDLERLQILDLDIANITEITMPSLAIGVHEEKGSTQTRDDNSYEGPIERLSFLQEKA